MKIHELLGYPSDIKQESKGLNPLIQDFAIWISNEEAKLLEKLKRPTKLSQLTELEQTRVQSLIRKSLITKIGQDNPTLVINEKTI